MSGVILEIDPLSEDGANVPLVLVDNTAYFLLGEDWPAPEPDVSYVSSVSTEGELAVTARYRNTTGAFQLRIAGSSAADLQTKLNYIDKKLGKIMREGGTLKRTTPSGATYVTDLLSGSQSVGFDWRYAANNRAVASVSLARRPFWRGAAVTLSSHSELTLPCLVFTEASITGDVPALGRLIVTEAGGADQWWVTYGIQSRYYSSSADAALFYQAEGRTALGGSATNVGPTGASGSSVMRSATLTQSGFAILGTQATGGGNHLAHVGDYQVYARVQTANTGTVSLALEWAVGDYFRPTTNATATLGASESGLWRLVNLGQVSIPKVAQGTQRWEGRVLASSTAASDKVDVDYLMFVPVTEGAGIAQGRFLTASPTSLTLHDEFNQTAGALSGKTLPVGGTWSGAGSANDFQVVATGGTFRANIATKATSTDAARFEIAGITTFTNLLAQISFACTTTTNVGQGMALRYVDTSNYFVVQAANGVIAFSTFVAGGNVYGTTAPYQIAANTWYSLRACIDTNGRFAIWAFAEGATPGAPILTGYHSSLATGGALASGKVAMWDINNGTASPTRAYDNLWATTPSLDAAAFASKQLEIRNDRAIRQDSTGAFWNPISKFEGDYLLIPPSGREGRTSRVIVKGCRNDPATMADPAIDDITAQLVYTPRFLTLPE